MAERDFACVNKDTFMVDTVIVYNPEINEWPLADSYIMLDLDVTPIRSWVFNEVTLEWDLVTDTGLPLDVATGFKYEDNLLVTTASLPPLPAPYWVMMQQMRIELLKRDQLALVEPIIAAIPDATQRNEVQIEWGYSPDILRDDAWFIYIATQLGYDSEGIDKLFIRAVNN